MIYTAVFQDNKHTYSFETHVSSHDRIAAWHDIHEKREDENSCHFMDQINFEYATKKGVQETFERGILGTNFRQSRDFKILYTG